MRKPAGWIENENLLRPWNDKKPWYSTRNPHRMGYEYDIAALNASRIGGGGQTVYYQRSVPYPANTPIVFG